MSRFQTPRTLRQIKNRSHAPAWLLLAGLLLALAACGPVTTPTAVAGNPLAGTEWELVSLGGDPLLEDTYISIEFDEDRVGGFAGCNHYGGGPDSGGYSVSDRSIEIGQLAITLMECLDPKGVMDQEAAYLNALANATTYRLEADTLTLQNADGATILSFQRVESSTMDPAGLIGTTWRLVSLDGQPPAEGSTVTLTWHNEHRAAGSAGCRGFVSGYEAEGDELTFTSTAMMGDTCAGEALQRQEGEYTTILGWANRFRLDRDRLELYTVRGEVLTYETLPAEAQPAVEGPTWRLLAFLEASSATDLPQPIPLPVGILPGSEITVTFDDGQVSGIAGCNQYGGNYSLKGASLATSDLFHTEMACAEPEGVMEQETRYLQALRQATTGHVYGTQLWLETADGSSLVFTAE